jgi:hypothetical protein
MRMPPGLMGQMAGSPARRPGGLAVGSPGVGPLSPGARPMSREEVVARLQGLSKDELDSFETALRQQKSVQYAVAADPGPMRQPGMASTSPATHR